MLVFVAGMAVRMVLVMLMLLSVRMVMAVLLAGMVVAVRLSLSMTMIMAMTVVVVVPRMAVPMLPQDEVVEGVDSHAGQRQPSHHCRCADSQGRLAAREGVW